MTAATTTRSRVDWPAVGLFYGIAFGGATVVAAALFAMGGLETPVAQLVVVLLYMPMPLVAALVVEQRAGRGFLLVRGWRASRGRRLRTAGRIAGWSFVVAVAVLAAQVLVAWGAASLGAPGAGQWASDAELMARLRELQPALPAGVTLSTWALLGITFVQALVAGFTINAVVAFGEEYGWRGVLADLLEPLGRWRYALIGVLWGLWHAPIIRLGHNYGPDWAWGIPLMVLWCVPLSYVLGWARERAGSTIAPAIVHGTFNGFAGIFLLVLIGADRLTALPVGLWAALPSALLGLLLWTVWRPRR